MATKLYATLRLNVKNNRHVFSTRSFDTLKTFVNYVNTHARLIPALPVVYETYEK